MQLRGAERGKDVEILAKTLKIYDPKTDWYFAENDGKTASQALLRMMT